MKVSLAERAHTNVPDLAIHMAEPSAINTGGP
jgi:hypothetical protein